MEGDDRSAVPVTHAVLHDPADKTGIDREKLAFVMDLKNNRRGRIMEYAERFSTATFTPVDPSRSYNPLWAVPAQAAFPSATQNEINAEDAGMLAPSATM